MPARWVISFVLLFALSGRRFAAGLTQSTVYDAGTSYWETQGHAVAVPLSSLRSFCSSPGSLPDEDGLQAFVLSSPNDVVDLQFNGTAISILGITFAYTSCEEGQNPAAASLEVAPPPPSSPPPPPAGGGDPMPAPPMPGCVDYPVPIADCNVELARWSGLDSNNRHRVYVSTTGAKVAVLSARVLTDAASAEGPVVLPGPSAPSPVTTTETRSTTLDPAPRPPSPTASVPSTSSQTGTPAASLPVSNSADRPDGGQGSPPRRDSQHVVAIVCAVIGTLVALSVVVGVLYARRRRSKAQPFGLPSSGAVGLGRPEKRQKIKLLFPRHPPSPPATSSNQSADELGRAITDAGLTTHELLASLNRLRGERRVSPPGLSSSRSPETPSPPGYER